MVAGAVASSAIGATRLRKRPACWAWPRVWAFPPQLLQNFLIARSNDPYFNPDAFTLWDELKGLFTAMNDGSTFGPEKINKFNGGLFAPDPALEKLRIPNSVFCRTGQGQNEASLYLYKDTLLYICASYNYASTWAQGLDRAPLVEAASANSQAVKSLGLYTLGRIFEQSITELEILEAEADGRLSLNEISKRKRDGVYYTPEWVVERIVDETLGPRFAELKRECGWPADGQPSVAAIDAFTARLRSFGRHQNLDKQETAKLFVAQTVPELRVSFDAAGGAYLNNVRVNGILSADDKSPWFLLGILNAKVADFVFRRIAKVKDGGFYEANKQFIAPLPIPSAAPDEQKTISDMAKALQASHTRRRDVLGLITSRMDTVRKRTKPAEWLFPSIKPKTDWERDAPAGLDLAEKRAWATKRYDDDLATSEAAVGERIMPGVMLDASFTDGELSFLINGVPVISRIFEEQASGAFILAQWKVLAASMPITDSTTGRKLCNALRKLATNDASAAVNQIMQYQTELAALDKSIMQQESDMNTAVYRLYGLTPDEIRLVERG
jgi:hypothetical protein